MELRRLLGQLLKCDMSRVPYQGAPSLVRILVRLSITACDDPYQFVPAGSRLAPCLHALSPDARTHSPLAIRLCGVKARLLVDPGYEGFQSTSFHVEPPASSGFACRTENRMLSYRAKDHAKHGICAR